MKAGGKVGHADQRFVLQAAAEENHDAVIPVIRLQPLEACPSILHLIQGGLFQVQPVELTRKLLYLRVAFVRQQEPIQLVIVLPLDEVTKLAAHEQQLFAGMSHRIAIQRPKAREFLPQVARLLIQHRALAMHHLIMRERKNKVFIEGVVQ